MAVSYEKLLEKARRMREDYARLCLSAVHPAVAGVCRGELELQLLPGQRTRLLLYAPENAAGPLPVYVVFHSGAFARGSARLDDYVNAVTAVRVGCLVAAVEFRLAPEARFPTQIMECAAAVEWIAAHCGELNADPARIAVGGHNSGGTIAAAVCLLLRRRGAPRLRCAVLDCAMFTLYSDLPELPDFDMDDPLRGPIRGVFFNTCYLGDLRLGYRDELASPLLAEDLGGLPPTLVVIAGRDAARADAEAYFRRLKEAGNDCELKCYEGLPHGFNVQPGLAEQSTVDASFRFLDEYLIRKFEL